jgi:DNA-directed RNA polymerase subunit L
MEALRYSLLADGPSDSCLMQVIEWLLSEHEKVRTVGYVGQFADLRTVEPKPDDLGHRILTALDLYPCDILFVHRDAEREPLGSRLQEIAAAMDRIQPDAKPQLSVPVVPVRMMEAWLLFDERAIRLAAGNPNGRAMLDLPAASRVETVADPKAVLQRALEVASEKSGRRLRKFRTRISAAVHRVADQIEDYSPLRAAPAFASFESTTRAVLDRLLH